jgi:hypothetical protein
MVTPKLIIGAKMELVRRPRAMTAVANLIMLSGLLVTLGVGAATEPFGSLSLAEKALLKPKIERWVRDQIKHDWTDLWEIQDQTPELKNELLLGRKCA